jgi:uncharacterized membrane protein YdjX (TVP38/TMEM64 family)
MQASAFGAFAYQHPEIAIIAFILLRSSSVIYPPIPGFPIDLIGLEVFGLWPGLELAEAGIMLGATTAFIVARGARRAFLLSRSRTVVHFRQLTDRARSPERVETPSSEFLWWLAIRLMTNPLFDPLSYAAGLTRAAFGPYFLATFLGNLPSTLIFFLLESRVSTASWAAKLGLLLLFLAGVSLLGTRWLNETEGARDARRIRE